MSLYAWMHIDTHTHTHTHTHIHTGTHTHTQRLMYIISMDNLVYTPIITWSLCQCVCVCVCCYIQCHILNLSVL